MDCRMGMAKVANCNTCQCIQVAFAVDVPKPGTFTTFKSNSLPSIGGHDMTGHLLGLKSWINKLAGFEKKPRLYFFGLIEATELSALASSNWY
jgi:hypothetical protein